MWVLSITPWIDYEVKHSALNDTRYTKYANYLYDAFLNVRVEIHNTHTSALLSLNKSIFIDSAYSCTCLHLMSLFVDIFFWCFLTCSIRRVLIRRPIMLMFFSHFSERFILTRDWARHRSCTWTPTTQQRPVYWDPLPECWTQYAHLVQ